MKDWKAIQYVLLIIGISVVSDFRDQKRCTGSGKYISHGGAGSKVMRKQCTGQTLCSPLNQALHEACHTKNYAIEESSFEVLRYKTLLSRKTSSTLLQ